MINNVSIYTELSGDFVSYAVATANRAIPLSTDGLKVSHRRVIQTLIESKFNGLVKTAKVAGLVSGNLHPHGDCSGTIQGMADASSYLQPLLNLQGNQGGWSRDSRQKISSDNAASSRYTESSLSPLGSHLFDLIVRTRPNYDGTMEEVEEYSTALPLSLINCNSGIGTGYAVNSVGFPVDNLIKALECINNKEKSIKSLDYPDVPWNTNIVKSSKELEELHLTGKSSLKLIGEWVIEKKNIIVTKLATGNVDQFIEKIKSGVESGKITGISKVSDETSKEIRVVIGVKRGSEPIEVIRQLKRHTSLTDSLSVNSTFVDSFTRLPRLFTPYELLISWYETRTATLKVKYSLEEEKYLEELMLKEKLLSILPSIRQVVDTIVDSETVTVAKERLMLNYGLDEVVTLAILDISLKQLTKLNADKLMTEVVTLKENLRRLNQLLTCSVTLHNEIVTLAKGCSKYCSKRVSSLVK